MLSDFDRGIAVRPLGDGSFAGELSAGFVVGGGVNGGYVLAVLGQAVRAASSHPDPLSVSAHYLSASRPGPCEVTVEPLREGRGTSTFRAELRQDGQTRIAALATYGDLGALTDDVRTTAPPPDLPPREECVANDTPPPGMEIPLLERSDMLVPPSFLRGPSGRGEISAWFRLRDERDPDPLSLLFAVDALPPATFDLGLYGWAPTVSLNVHVRARPAPGWLRLRHATRNVAGGWFEEDAEVWDEAGRLVAQSRQLALMPRSGASA